MKKKMYLIDNIKKDIPIISKTNLSETNKYKWYLSYKSREKWNLKISFSFKSTYKNNK